MTIESWKEEFYPVRVTDFVNLNPLTGHTARTDIELVEHALKKWRGLTAENLKKHGLHRWGSWIFQFTYNAPIKFLIADNSCSLCRVYIGDRCKKCPLIKMHGGPCDSAATHKEYSPYSFWSRKGDPEPMLNLLERTLKHLKEKEKDEVLEKLFGPPS